MSEGERKRWKVDEYGAYQRFVGLTFISALELEHRSLFEPLLKLLSPGVTNYSALPIDSLHVTIKNHETASHLGIPYERYVEDRLLRFCSGDGTDPLRKSVNYLKEAQYRPRAKCVKIEVESTVRVLLKLENSPYEVIDKLVELGSRPEPGFVFHMTLAYRFDQQRKDPENLKKLEELFNEHLKDKVLSFEELKLNYFPSMVKFIPIH
jgi:hypothetical protein